MRVNDLLAREHPDAHCELDFTNAYELAVATVLSAQCTDVRVNQVTPALFKKYPSPLELSQARIEDVEEIIRPTGFFHNKAKNIIGLANAVMERYGGEIPGVLEELVTLPGVGRKTANVVLGNAFGVPGLTVDTHFKRVSKRLGLTRSDDPVQIEREMMEIVPTEEWTMFSRRIIFHGRRVCKARKPLCSQCGLKEVCPSYE